MARFKNTEWNFTPTSAGQIPTWEQAQVAVLMDIRDELQRLNALLYCPNFTGIPHTLKKIERHTAPKRKKPAAKGGR